MTNEFDIIEHSMVAIWFKEFAKTDPLGLCFLTQSNKNIFRQLWGEPNGSTHKFDYWKRDYLGINIYVYSDESATFYKIQYLGEKESFQQDKKVGSYITGFLTKLTKEVLS